jgi:hypothetical protein
MRTSTATTRAVDAGFADVAATRATELAAAARGERVRR